MSFILFIPFGANPFLQKVKARPFAMLYTAPYNLALLMSPPQSLQANNTLRVLQSSRYSLPRAFALFSQIPLLVSLFPSLIRIYVFSVTSSTKPVVTSSFNLWPRILIPFPDLSFHSVITS